MKSKSKLYKEQSKDIEKQFFYFDEEKKVVCLSRAFEAPEEILDLNAHTKTPVMRQDFVEWLTGLFDYVPKKYKLDIEITLRDLGGFSEQELTDICRKNMILERKIQTRKANKQNILAFFLCTTGLSLVLLYIWLESVWISDGAINAVIMFILEILATVPFWGAIDIFLVGNGEQRTIVQLAKKRFHAITIKKDPDSPEEECDKVYASLPHS